MHPTSVAENLNRILQGKIKVAHFCGPHKWQYLNPEGQAVVTSLRPFSNDYFGPLNPAFLCEYSSRDSLNEFPVILVRDGVGTLLDFFTQYPTPEGLRPILLITHSLASLVPPEWLNQVAFWSLNLNPLPGETQRPPENLIFLSMVNTSYCGTNYLQKTLKFVKEQLGHSLKHMKLHGLIFMEDDEFFDPPFEVVDPCYEFTQVLQAELGRPLLYHSWENFLRLEDLRNMMFVDLEENQFSLSDNTVVHYLLSRGAKPFHKNHFSSSTPQTFMNLSPYHQLALYFIPPKNYLHLRQQILKIWDPETEGIERYDSLKEIARKINLNFGT